VFDLFTVAKRKGTNGEKSFGIGLAITKKIVELHNGQIYFETKESKGTRFIVELPLLA
jgi:signal transduction histidine kinase